MIRIFRRRKPDPNAEVVALLKQLIYQGKIIMADLTNLNAAVAANTAAVAAVATEVANLRASTDQVGVDAATAQINTNNAALQALITPPSS